METEREKEEQSRRLQEFMGREFGWRFTAYECNFLVQLLAYVVQENPKIVPDSKGEKEALNYQSIRTIVLLNEKLSSQLQERASESSVLMEGMQTPPDRVQ